MLLGLLQVPASGYDLKKHFDCTVRFFWPAELSQVYPTLQRMERDGLLKSQLKSSSKGPKRRVYSLTKEGRDALLAWLRNDPALGDQRYEFIAQFFFMDAADDEHVTTRYITRLRGELVRRLETYEQIEREWLGGEESYPDPDSSRGFHRYMALRSGLLHMAARIGWCNDVLRRLARRHKGRTRPGKRGTQKRIAGRRKI